MSLASGGAVETWPVLGMLTGIAGCKGQEHMWTGARLHVWLQYISFCPALTGRELFTILSLKFTIKSKVSYGLF